MYYHDKPAILQFVSPCAKIGISGVIMCIAAAIATAMHGLLWRMYIVHDVLSPVMMFLNEISVALLTCGIAALLAAAVWAVGMTDAQKIKIMIQRRLFDPRYGNPLHYKEGERLPKITCRATGRGRYALTITATSNTVQEIIDISTSISSGLNRKYGRYAVTQSDADMAFGSVTFTLNDVTADRSLKVHKVDELRQTDPAKIIVQDGTYIDLTTSGSMISAGKTRSGKTTGVISILLQALQAGRDKYGSEIVIIDPKQAELSRLNHVYTLDVDGEARGILEAIRQFADTIKKRQKVLNDLSAKEGDAVHWWDAGMHVSLLFIDEYIALRGIFPKRAVKDDEGYNLAEFDTILKRIVTMGASAGCYAIISIAEASVDEGGLPAMLRSACSTKILFRPTPVEGRFLWDSERLRDMPQRFYQSGDAWFSSTDGEHDTVTYVHFPIMKFRVYGELNRLLGDYYRE
ncbi:MAG: hypothetical protein K2N34_15335 [Lachnospiraceae bacterium]|nr:hypothetical protein [Lachnospiraceae bacterium]